MEDSHPKDSLGAKWFEYIILVVWKLWIANDYFCWVQNLQTNVLVHDTTGMFYM